jgi:uncharacterized protein
MSAIETTAPEPIQGLLESLEDGKFKFACHPGVPCFTECCRDLKLVLTPYDIVKLTKALGLDARSFLDLHTETVFDEQRGLPMVYLKMQENERRTCPFVSPAGCTVYSGRPSACRIYPLARASRMHRAHGTVIEDYFVLHESHCVGFEEDRVWNVREWLGDQGLIACNDMNNRWMEIVTHPRLRQGDPLSSKQQQMFFLASYNMDQFRDFVLKSRFLSIFEISPEEVQGLTDSDEHLLAMACRWLKFALLNEPELKMRNAPAGA